MHPLDHVFGVIAPLVRDNIDTDQIIPKQFLTTVTRDGLGNYVFDSWRFLDEGKLGLLPEDRHRREDFVLNTPPFDAANILLCGANFGCGSSREHATWSLMDYGFRAIIAENFSDIFYSNAVTNGLLPAMVAADVIQDIVQLVMNNPTQECKIDVEKQTITIGEYQSHFYIDAASKHKILRGVDAIGFTLGYSDAIRSFEKKHLATYPWLDSTFHCT